MQLTNSLKETLRGGGTAVGCFVQMPSPEVVEICALAGFDFVLMDAEHGPISPESCYPMLLAAEANRVPAIARIGQQDRQVILKFLDIGISGVMVPQVNTAQAAEDAVAALKYQPRGLRGIAGGRSFAWGFGDSPKNLVPRLNERMLTIVQFEHNSAMDELDAILATPDLDVLFVGPNDLAQSMGFPGEPNHPEVQALIDRVIAATRGGSVTLGTVAADAESINHQLERGFRMIGANAATLLARAAGDLLANVRR
ncbi:MAG: aldolase/citrate lyase family protein [Chloroflexota bacterium]|nr:aldolase/citrate lyase family protein [Chloroflexota bacterium]MDP9469411.1 aldolase/citrate lyase family protein [Chloroflexota bacterium]